MSGIWRLLWKPYCLSCTNCSFLIIKNNDFVEVRHESIRCRRSFAWHNWSWYSVLLWNPTTGFQSFTIWIRVFEYIRWLNTWPLQTLQTHLLFTSFWSFNLKRQVKDERQSVLLMKTQTITNITIQLCLALHLVFFGFFTLILQFFTSHVLEHQKIFDRWPLLFIFKKNIGCLCRMTKQKYRNLGSRLVLWQPRLTLA